MILGRLRLLRRTRELVNLVRDLRRVERAEALIESGPIDVPWDVPGLAPLPAPAAPSSAAPISIIDDEPTQPQYVPSWIFGG